MQSFKGKLPETLEKRKSGFIRLDSVKQSTGEPHGLDTEDNIFFHQDDSNDVLRPGAEVEFEVVQDQRRTGGPREGNCYRAVNIKLVGNLVLAGEYALADPSTLYVPPTAAQVGAKPIAPEMVEQVLKNQPMALVPRQPGPVDDKTQARRELLQRAFPQLFAIESQYGGDIVTKDFDDVVAKAVETHRDMGMKQQADFMEKQVGVYRGMRDIISSADDLLEPGAILPIHYLPDLFMGVPVWYFMTDEKTSKAAKKSQQDSDPSVHPILKHFCDLFKNKQWSDTFLMYNRRMRTLADYQGDIIPPKIISRMQEMSSRFDYLTIMTPYHDVAGKDWQDFEWLRTIDPYVVGFTKELPLMFVLGRFSDSGVFPLHSELVSDTINFLRTNKAKLEGFNAVRSPYWYWPTATSADVYPQTGHVYVQGDLGDRLMKNVNQILKQFEKGTLFDWLRGYKVE